MSVRQYRGKKGRIVDRLLRNEEDKDIVTAEHTSLNYIRNIRSQLRKQGVIFGLRDSSREAQASAQVTESNPPLSNQAVPDYLEPSHATGAGSINAAPNITGETLSTDPELQALTQDVGSVKSQISKLALRQERQQLLAKEAHLKEETQLQATIADIVSDPREMLTNRTIYVQAMVRILLTQPWSEQLSAVAPDLGWGWVGWRLTDTLNQRFNQLSVGYNLGVYHPSETLVRDLVVDFLGYVRNSEFAHVMSRVASMRLR